MCAPPLHTATDVTVGVGSGWDRTGGSATLRKVRVMCMCVCERGGGGEGVEGEGEGQRT